MKQIIISVLSLVMMLSLSMGIMAEEASPDFISVEDAFAAMEAEDSAPEVDTEEGVSTLSAAKSAIDASVSYDRVAVTSYKQVVDTFNGVPAYYEPVTSGSDFQCSEYIKRYYNTVYGSNLQGYQKTTTPKPGDYIYATASERGKSYGHYAVIKSVSDGQLTLIEQNWAWRTNGTVYAAKNRVIPYGGSYSGTYTIYSPIGTPKVNIGNAISTETTSGFSDVSSNHWAYSNIMSLVNSRIISGYSDGTFKPNGEITRAEFMGLIAKHAITLGNNVPNYTIQRFDDVPASHWAHTYINWAKVKGIVSGNSETTFDPESNITREEMAVILYNYGVNILGKSFASSSSTFSDRSQVSHWATTAVNAMATAGIITGHDDGSFAPQANATRAEAATMIYRLIG